MQISNALELLLKGFIAVALIAIILAFNTTQMAIAPDNARVYFNTATKTYAAPYCIHEDLYEDAALARQARGTLRMLLAEGNSAEADQVFRRYRSIIESDAAWSKITAKLGSLKSLGYQADEDCQSSGAFVWQENALMVHLGILDSPSGRWSVDGNWNW